MRCWRRSRLWNVSSTGPATFDGSPIPPPVARSSNSHEVGLPTSIAIDTLEAKLIDGENTASAIAKLKLFVAMGVPAHPSC
jgi:hypothetical protein